MKPSTEGAVCLFTIKNPSYPEHICMTDSGVMCVDIHPKYPYMVVVGQFDGNVLVFNVQATCKKPAFKSNAVVNKHTGIISEVSKHENLPDLSISTQIFCIFLLMSFRLNGPQIYQMVK